jgi:hypothetical protein
MRLLTIGFQKRAEARTRCGPAASASAAIADKLFLKRYVDQGSKHSSKIALS